GVELAAALYAYVVFGGGAHRLCVELPHRLALRAECLGEDAVSARVEEVVLAVNAVADARVVERVPEVRGRGRGGHNAERVAFVAPRICCVAEPFEEGRCVSARREAV